MPAPLARCALARRSADTPTVILRLASILAEARINLVDVFVGMAVAAVGLSMTGPDFHLLARVVLVHWNHNLIGRHISNRATDQCPGTILRPRRPLQNTAAKSPSRSDEVGDDSVLRAAVARLPIGFGPRGALAALWGKQ